MWPTGSITTMNLNEITKLIQEKISVVPKAGIILGSGLGGFTEQLTDSVSIDYSELPGYPRTKVPGHAGKFITGKIGELPVVCARGRFHYYEGHDINTVTLPVDIFNKLGCDTVIVTNAAGCVRTDWYPGDLMLITNCIDFTFRNNSEPIIINNNSIDDRMQSIALDIAKENGITLHSGTYTWTLGPSYETPAEIQMIKEYEGDAVGMSTMPEIDKAASCGMNVIGISCLSNYAAGITSQPLTHLEVLEVVDSSKKSFTILVNEILKNI